MWSANVIKQMGPAAKPLLPSLIASIKNNGRHVRSSAVEAIANIGPEAKSAMPILRELLKDKDVKTRAFAAAAMWKIEKDSTAIPFLLSELEKGGYDVNYVINAIGLVGKPASQAIPLIQKQLKNQDQFARESARKTLKKLQSK